MRIASIHVAFDEIGGAERCVLEQAGYLKRNHSIDLFATYIKPSFYHSDLKGFEVRQLLSVSSPIFPLFTSIAAGTLLARSFRREFEQYDVLLSHQEPAHWIAYCAKRPYIVQIHSLPTVLYPDCLEDAESTLPLLDSGYVRLGIRAIANFRGRKFLRWIDQKSVQEARKVLAPFGKMIGRAIHDMYGVNAVQIPFGIDFSRYCYTSPAQVFAKHSINHPMILMVTRPVPIKRPDLLIRILPKILRDHPTATLVIVSEEGRYTSFLRRLARRFEVEASTRILSTSQHELNALYSGASVFGFPTQAPETLGRVVIEAMYFGVPPVVWDNGWGPAEVVKDGVGLRAQSYDIDDFLDKILALLNDNDERKRMGEKAKHYVVREFSWQRAGPVLEEILQRTIQE